MAIVDAVLLVLKVLKMDPARLVVAVWASLVLLLAACGSEGADQAQVASVTPTPIPTTSPLSVPTPTLTPVPAPTSTALPQFTPTPVSSPTAAPTTPPTSTEDLAPTPTPASDAAPTPTPTVAASPTATAEVTDTATPIPTPTAEETNTEEDASDPTPTATAETPTAVVVASGEAPLECYDAQVQLYRAFVDGVDELSFEGGKVSCGGAGTNAVSAARSYRHSSGLIIQRNANFIFNEGGTAYIPYSGAVHFCMNGQPASAPVRADTVPALLIVIDNEAQRQVAQGASAPAAFTNSGSQC